MIAKTLASNFQCVIFDYVCWLTDWTVVWSIRRSYQIQHWLKWVLEYIQCFIVDSARGEPTDHKSDWWYSVIIEQFVFIGKIQNSRHKNLILLISPLIVDINTWFLRQTLHFDGQRIKWNHYLSYKPYFSKLKFKMAATENTKSAITLTLIDI